MTTHPNHDSKVQQNILEEGSREQIIAWLCWNDRNGCYTDSDCEAEGLEILTIDDARQIMRDQLN